MRAGELVAEEPVDVLIVGAGFAGLYMLHRAREAGFTALVVEAGDDVGGTWYWNRYPGARCDVESLDYCYGFSPELLAEWEWSERFATQPEILRYIAHVADRFDLRRDVLFGTRVTAARWDEGRGAWQVVAGEGTVEARFLVMATGCLSLANVPSIPGLDDFAGPVLHTGRWPQGPVDLTGRIGVVGTGSSGIQVIPELARTAAHLAVFQRTPNYSLPAVNGPIDPDHLARRRADYPGYKQRAFQTAVGFEPRWPSAAPTAAGVPDADLEAELERRWQAGGTAVMFAYQDVMQDGATNERVAAFVRGKIAAAVEDPELARRLTPGSHPIGAKRICVDSGYHATFNLPHVALVDLRQTPIVRVVPGGVETTEGLHPLDVLVLATGFDAMSGPLLDVDITGRGGRALRQEWADGPVSLLGLGVYGFPNLFTITGPGSPSVRVNMTIAIEQHVDWVARCLAFVRGGGWATVEPTAAAQEAWVRHVAAAAAGTLFVKADSWYNGANLAGKPRVFAPYVGTLAEYVQRCEAVVAAGYSGYALGRGPAV